MTPIKVVEVIWGQHLMTLNLNLKVILKAILFFFKQEPSFLTPDFVKVKDFMLGYGLTYGSPEGQMFLEDIGISGK